MPSATNLDRLRRRIDVARLKGKEFPEAKVIILTTYTGDADGAMKLGARAYLLKTELHKELLGTIRAVYSGR